MQFNFNVAQQQALNLSNTRPPSQQPNNFSPQFAQLMINVVGMQNPGAVAQSQKSQTNGFQKEKLEIGKVQKNESEEDESVYATVRKMEQKLVKLARLERQMMAGF